MAAGVPPGHGLGCRLADGSPAGRLIAVLTLAESMHADIELPRLKIDEDGFGTAARAGLQLASIGFVHDRALPGMIPQASCPRSPAIAYRKSNSLIKRDRRS